MTQKNVLAIMCSGMCTGCHSFLKSVSFSIMAMGIILLLFAIVQPVNFRLLVLQPMRDLVFFQRELQPHQYLHDIEIATPSPAQTVTLSENETDPYSVELVLDLWIPDTHKAPVAVLFHGSSPHGRKLGINLMLAQRLQNAGWFVVSPDARGFGQSGTPDAIQDPVAWQVTKDASKIIAYATNHKRASKPLIVIGHSLGANHILEGLTNNKHINGIILIGPSRYTKSIDKHPSVWRRLRFSSDRRLSEIISADVLYDRMNRGDIKLFARSVSLRENQVPILLLDGEMESKREREFLKDVSEIMAPSVGYKTISGSGHYCGVYQLPFVKHIIYYRSTILDRCMKAKLKFMENIVSSTRTDTRNCYSEL